MTTPIFTNRRTFVAALFTLVGAVLVPEGRSAGQPPEGRRLQPDRVVRFEVPAAGIATRATSLAPREPRRVRGPRRHAIAPDELRGGPAIGRVAPVPETTVDASAADVALAPHDIVVQRNTGFVEGQFAFGFQGQVNEPSVGSMGQALFQTTNWSAMRSVDNGATWAYIDPYTQFPTNYFPFVQGFCCDQRVAQDPHRGMILWYLQYLETGFDPSDTNGVRVAAARSTADLANNTWAYWDFTPGMFGLTAPGSPAGLGYMFDFPHMEVSSNFLWVTTNYFRVDNVFAEGSVIFRLPLQALKDGTAFTAEAFITQAFFSPTTVHGATGVAYFASRFGPNAIKVVRWPESQPAPTIHDVTGLSTTFTGTMDCTGPDFRNPCDRADTRMQTGWLTSSELGFMWHSTQNAAAGRPFPFSRWVVLQPSSLAVLQDADIFSSASAFLYPAVSVSARGHLGGVIDNLGGAIFPTMTLMLRDDVSGPNFQFATVGPGSVRGSNLGWGDYNGSQPHTRYPRTWLVGAHVQLNQTTGDHDSNSRNIWFGRQRDMFTRIAGDFDGDGQSNLAVYRSGQFLVQGGASPAGAASPGDLIAIGDYDGDGIVDPGSFRAGAWTIVFSGSNSASTIAFGAAGDIPVPADYDGDRVTNVAVYRPSTGAWFVRPPNGGAPIVMGLGGPGDVPVPADYDGDGRADAAVYRRATAVWFLATGGGVTTIPFGAVGDIPVPADYNGDGSADLAVWRPGTGTFFARNIVTVSLGAPGDIPMALDVDGDGWSEAVVFRRATAQWFGYNVRSTATTAATFGAPGDLPVFRPPWLPSNLPGDFEGDLRADLTVFRPSTGQWFVSQSSNLSLLSAPFGAASDIPVPGDYLGILSNQFAVYRPSNGAWYISGGLVISLGGQAGDVPLRADVDGDGRQDPAIFRPATATFHALPSSAGYVSGSLLSVPFGTSGDRPAVGDYDGDFKTDFAVFRPSTGRWFILLSSTGLLRTTVLGAAADVRIPQDYDGDGKDDVAVYRPATGRWTYTSSITGGTVSFVFGGESSDTPLAADFDGDGRADPVIARDAGGVINWYVRNIVAMVFGNSGDIPVLRTRQ